MFRRPRNRPAPNRFPRARKRTGAADTPFEFTQKIESGLSAILGFFADMARVIYRMFRHPLSFDRYADAKGNLAPSVRPFTFLALTAFIAANAVRALTTSILLVMLSFARCSAPETQEEVTYPNMASLLKLPAVEDVLLTALPSVLLSVLFLTLFLRAFRSQAFAGRGKVLNLCLYIVGLQYLLLAFSVAWFISGDLFNKEADADGSVSPLMSLGSDAMLIGYIVAAALLVLGWPALLAWTQIVKLMPPSSGRAGARAARAARATFAALFLSLGTLPFGLLISIPLSRFDLARQAAPHPTLEVAMLFLSTGVEPAALRVLITNRSNRTLRLSKGFFEYQYLSAPERQVNKASIVRWQSGDDYLLTIRPGDSAWVEVTLAAAGSSSSCADIFNRNNWRDEKWKSFPPPTPVYWWGFGISTYPTPKDTKGKMCMENVLASGRKEPVFAFVKSRS